MKVRDVMTGDPLTVRTDTPFKDIVRTMDRHCVSGLPVVDDAGRVLGIVTTADLMFKEHRPDHAIVRSPGARSSTARAERLRRVHGCVAGELMSTPAVRVDADADLRIGARLLSRHGIARLAVTSRGKIVGMLSRGDVLKAFMRSDADLRREIETTLRHDVASDTSGVKVAIDDGVVRLTGSVELASTKHTIHFHVERVDGVTRVIDDVLARFDDIAARASVPQAGPLSDAV